MDKDNSKSIIEKNIVDNEDGVLISSNNKGVADGNERKRKINFQEPEIGSSKKQKKKKSKKKKKQKSPKMDETISTNKGNNLSDKNEEDDDGDDDENEKELLQAAAAWANQEEEEEEDDNNNKVEYANDENTKRIVSSIHRSEDANNNTRNGQEMSDKIIYSLHITQLPYDAMDWEVRQFFVEQECLVTSVRLVYDRDEFGRKTVFRGVAFVDVKNQESFNKALQLHHKITMRGRRLNIRPTRTHTELSNIVSRTNALVHELMQRSKEGKKNGNDENKNKNSTKQKRSITSKSNLSHNSMDSLNNTNSNNNDKVSRNKQRPRRKKQTDRKLSKKERNRRAAIVKKRIR